MIMFEMSHRTHRTRLSIYAAIALLAGTVGVTAYIVYTRSFQIAGTYVERVQTDAKVVALTFDDGPRQAALNELLPILRQRATPATFYVIGSEIQRDPTAMQAIARAGHEIGNHGLTHVSLAFATPARIDHELATTDQLIRASGYSGPITYRPAYGHKFVALPLYLRSRNIVTVSRDVPADANIPDSATAQTIADKAVRMTRPGSIILLHTMYPINYKSRQAVPLIIDQLQAKGYRFVTVSELLQYAQPR
jgi:peptidoglycan-N-acetylglucosamine deacetylase